MHFSAELCNVISQSYLTPHLVGYCTSLTGKVFCHQPYQINRTDFGGYSSRGDLHNHSSQP